MQSKLAILTTGGTIAAQVDVQLGLRNPSHGVKTNINDILKSTALEWFDDVHIENIHPIASENISPIHWRLLLRKISELASSGYNSILVTHGTDTIDYSANFIDLSSVSGSVKVCFTGSMIPICSTNTDAIENLNASLALLSSEGAENGVYIAFKNSEDTCEVYYAKDFSPFQFDSIYASAYQNRAIAKYNIASRQFEFVGPLSQPKLKRFDNELVLNAQSFQSAGNSIGIVFSTPLLKKREIEQHSCTYLLVLCYHSGTAPVDALKAAPHDVKILASVFDPPNNEIYTSTRELLDSGFLLLKSMGHARASALVFHLALAGANQQDVCDWISH